jgi:hypothetical protein
MANTQGGNQISYSRAKVRGMYLAWSVGCVLAAVLWSVSGSRSLHGDRFQIWSYAMLVWVVPFAMLWGCGIFVIRLLCAKP